MIQFISQIITKHLIVILVVVAYELISHVFLSDLLKRYYINREENVKLKFENLKLKSEESRLHKEIEKERQEQSRLKKEIEAERQKQLRLEKEIAAKSTKVV